MKRFGLRTVFGLITTIAAFLGLGQASCLCADSLATAVVIADVLACVAAVALTAWVARNRDSSMMREIVRSVSVASIVGFLANLSLGIPIANEFQRHYAEYFSWQRDWHVVLGHCALVAGACALLGAGLSAGVHFVRPSSRTQG